ncbi:hypothetical protein OAH41_06545 [Paracoccaceae bacterium]|nr:hypothetical protein [Paracoccaceae bacterium]
MVHKAAFMRQQHLKAFMKILFHFAILLFFSPLRIPVKPSIPVSTGSIIELSACGTTNPNPAAIKEIKKLTVKPSTQT